MKFPAPDDGSLEPVFEEVLIEFEPEGYFAMEFDPEFVPWSDEAQ